MLQFASLEERKRGRGAFKGEGIVRQGRAFFLFTLVCIIDINATFFHLTLNYNHEDSTGLSILVINQPI